MSQSLYSIVTHSGSFHADEIMAVALLERFYLLRPVRVSIDDDFDTQVSWINGSVVPQNSTWSADGVEDSRTPVMLMRSRDARLLKEAKASATTFVLDVGGELNEGLLNFDHHQKSMKKTWPDGTPLSSTGLVWLWLKENNHLQLANEIIAELEEKIIKPLDAHDNGVAVSPIASHMAGYNRDSEDPAQQNHQFNQAKTLIKDTLENALYSAQMKLEATRVISQQWEKAKKHGDTHVLLSRPLEYKDCAGLLKSISKDQADMIIIPGLGNRFSVISLSKDVAFSIKSPCPSDWRGKSDFHTNIDGKSVMIRFAHKSGFMCVVEGSHKDAQKVARHIIAGNKLDHTSRLPAFKR